MAPSSSSRALHATSTAPDEHFRRSTALHVSEIHIPGYRETKKSFLPDDNDLSLQQLCITEADYSSILSFKDGYLIHKTNGYLFTREECESMVQEAEDVAAKMGWTTTRHGVRHFILRCCKS
jgi:hypothetical protein